MAYSFLNSTVVSSVSTAGFVVSAGDNLIIIAGDDGATGSTLTISDGTNSYVVRGTVNDTQHNATRTLIDCINPTPGTYTITEAGAGTPSFAILRYSGLTSFSVGSFASFFAINPPLTTDSSATAAITPSSYPAAIIAPMATTGGAPSVSVGTGFTSRLSSSWVFGNGVFAEDLRLISGSHIASYTPNAANSCTAIVAGAYLEIGGSNTASIAWVT